MTNNKGAVSVNDKKTAKKKVPVESHTILGHTILTRLIFPLLSVLHSLNAILEIIRTAHEIPIDFCVLAIHIK